MCLQRLHVGCVCGGVGGGGEDVDHELGCLILQAVVLRAESIALGGWLVNALAVKAGVQRMNMVGDEDKATLWQRCEVDSRSQPPARMKLAPLLAPALRFQKSHLFLSLLCRRLLQSASHAGCPRTLPPDEAASLQKPRGLCDRRFAADPRCEGAVGSQLGTRPTRHLKPWFRLIAPILAAALISSISGVMTASTGLKVTDAALRSATDRALAKWASAYYAHQAPPTGAVPAWARLLLMAPLRIE